MYLTVLYVSNHALRKIRREMFLAALISGTVR